MLDGLPTACVAKNRFVARGLDDNSNNSVTWCAQITPWRSPLEISPPEIKVN